MAQDFQSSFIPKEPITEGVFKKKRAGFWGVIAIALFVTSIIVSVGLFINKNMVKSDIADLQAELAEAEENIDKKTIGEMAQFSKKLTVIKSIISKHQVVSNFLNILASETVSSVQFTGFKYNSLASDDLAVLLRGKALGYSSIALQENVFAKNKYFKSVTFSNLNLIEGGQVSFDLALSVDPQVALYIPAASSSPSASGTISTEVASTSDDFSEFSDEELKLLGL